MKNILLYAIAAFTMIFMIKTFKIRTFINFTFILFIVFFCIILASDIHKHKLQQIKSKSKDYLTLLSSELTQNQYGNLLKWINEIEEPKIKAAAPNIPDGTNEVEILNSSEKSMAMILNAMNQAEHHIHMEYFIIKNGKIAENVKQMLIKKLNEGVNVRIIYDGFGSFFLKSSFIDDLRKSGAEIAAFSPPLKGITNLSLNHRNHRKLLIVDGKTAIIGDSNIGDEYFGKKTNLGKWKDTDIIIRGQAAQCLQAMFLRDWYLTKGDIITDLNYFPWEENIGKIPIQIITGGPDSPMDNIERIYFSIIQSAERQLLLVTPYLVPTEAIIKALENAVLRGVDVKIIIPDQSDNIVAEYATNMYANKLSMMGVKMFKYQNGFIHSKIIIMDEDLSMTGTANLDYRGMRLDYEVMAVIYDKFITEEFKEYFKEDLEKSVQIKFKEKQTFVDKVGEGIIHLIEDIL